MMRPMWLGILAPFDGEGGGVGGDTDGDSELVADGVGGDTDGDSELVADGVGETA